MFSNYFKLALKVLGRNKFFTGISLFGISFTLMILMLITAFYDTEFGKNPPLSNKDRLVFLATLKMERVVPDTTLIIDSVAQGGLMAYDTTFTYGEGTNSVNISSFSYYVLDNYLREPAGVTDYSFYSSDHSFNVFLDNRKLEVGAIYADAAYWRVFDFSMLEGEYFRDGQVQNATPVAVITDKLARQYFGRESGVLGQEVELGNSRFKVIGVVRRSRSMNSMVAGDIFLPLTTMEGRALDDNAYLGSFQAAYLLDRSVPMNKVQAELGERTARIPLRNPEEYNRISTLPMSFGELYASRLIDNNEPQKSLFRMRLVFGLLLLFFVLLPTLNLININISRIMERESEIGVRKAFGAHAGTILYQFVFENVIITFLGGIIGMVLALGLLHLINESQVLPHMILRFNLRVFAYSMGICLLFGIVSGWVPAWRVSRLQIADALKSNQL
jgi:putative ABC transport system permease protein